MQLNEAMNFQTELLKVRKLISRIKELNIDITKIEKLVDKIEKETKEDVDKTYEQHTSTEQIKSVFKGEYIAKEYIEGTKKLQELYKLLTDEYNNYSVINSSILNIENNIKTIDNINIKENIELMKNILSKLKLLSTMTFENEKDLIDNTYKLAYQLIKLELLFYNKSELLDLVLINEIDTNHVEKYLLEEINSLDFKKEEYQLIQNRINQLKTKGIDNTYLDLELLNILKTNNNLESIMKIKENIMDTYKLLIIDEQKVKYLNDNLKQVQKELDYCMLKKKTIKREKRKFKAAIIGGLLAIVGTISILYSAIKKSYTTIKNYTTCITYDINNDKQIKQEEYAPEPENKITITKYYPYERIGDGFYKREIHTFDISNINYEDIKDYKNIDLNQLNLAAKVNEQEEYFDKLLPSDLYEEPIIILTKKVVDKDKQIIEIKGSSGEFIVLTIVTSLIPLFIEISVWYWLILKKIDRDSFDEYNAVRVKITDYKKINIPNIIEQINEHYQLERDIATKIEQQYTKLPEIAITTDQELSGIKKKVLDIKNKNSMIKKNGSDIDW